MEKSARRTGSAVVVLYGTTLFLSAFLLFLVQPLLGKYILPWFGGAPSVWTTCMLFFQVLLLAGYSYAHLLASRFAVRRQATIQILLLAAALLALPILPSAHWKPAGSEAPAERILALLAIAAGAPFFLLSSASPLLQSWFGRIHPGVSPYRLYSLSNLGSLLAILIYPVLIEPAIPLNRQAALWSWGYALFALTGALCALCAVRAGDAVVPEAEPEPANGEVRGGEEGAPSPDRRALWLLIPACSSILLLATTNQLCQDVAVIPLLWVLPLGLYLVSFILCFGSARWYSRLWFGIMLSAALALTCYVLFGSVFIDLRLQIFSYSFTLFAGCMICHGELVRVKPHTSRLTAYYGMIAAGSALGSAFVTLAAPLLFKGFWEFHLGLLMVAVLFLCILFRDRGARLYDGRPLWVWTALYVGVILLAVSLAVHIRQSLEDCLEMSRNFFGVLRVLDLERDNPLEQHFTLMHGRIDHGFQYQAPEKRLWPTSYFGPGSGIGVALRHHPKRRGMGAGDEGLKIGIVGLGAGTLAAYGRPGDSIRFYEINPEILRLSSKYFTYVRHCPAGVEIVLGDARISMEREMQRGEFQKFDILAVDAFSSDAIPVHLLTRECYSVYRAHLKKDGILALHISSRYFDLAPVVRGLLAVETDGGMEALWIAGRGIESQGTDSSDWVLLTSNRDFLDSEIVRGLVRAWAESDPKPQLWTDDYSNLFHLLHRREK